MEIQVIFTTTSPYHSGATGEARVNLNGEFVPGPKGFPCIRTRHMPVITAGGKTDEAARSSRDVPIMPANSLRHQLRACMVEEVFDRLRGKYTLSVGAYAGAMTGNASGNPDGFPASFDEVKAIGDHVFLGLFGGGPRMIEGKLRVDAAWAITPGSLPILGEHEELSCPGDLTRIVFKRRVDPIVGDPARAEQMIADPATAITEWFSEFAQKKVASDEPETDGRGLRSFAAHEIVIPGVNWLWRIDVRKPTEAQKGLLLLAISAMRHVNLGGMSSQGYGRISIKSVVCDGEEIWGPAGLLENDSVFRALEAAGEALDAIAPEAFEAFVTSLKPDGAEDRPEGSGKPRGKKPAKKKEVAA